jgi:flagellar basal-body rod modification protein FlgD
MTTVAPTSSNNTASTSSPSAMQQLSGNFSTFLQLLTTQLQNQDPTSPMDTNQFTQQLVEYSQVEQQIDTNTNLKTLIGQSGTQNASYATSYLGKNVTVSGGNGALIDGKAGWTYNLGAASASTLLTVKNANGQTVYTAQGATTQGDNSFQWDGKDANGNQLSDGTYTLTAAASDGSGTAITSTVTSTGQVNEINMSNGVPQLMVGSMPIDLSAISSVSN